MKSLSVCLIVRDEEKCLENCLKSVSSFADEIVVVDTGSVDRTEEIARRYTDKVANFPWCDDFAKARNYSFSLATCDYIMWIDADDIVLDVDAKKIIEFKNSNRAPDVLMLKYVTAFTPDYKSEFSFYRERIVKRSMGFKWQDPVHEVITPRGQIEYMDISIYHNKKIGGVNPRNLRIYQSYISAGNKLSPRQQFYYARELYYNDKIDQAIGEFNKFLSSGQGWVENNIEACLNLGKCYELKGDYDKALTTLFGSFCLGVPRGEIICEIGSILILLKRFDEAILWFRLAKRVKPKLKTGAFVIDDMYDFIPNLQLCVCYYNKGKLKLAEYYHKKCMAQKPQHPSVIHNEKYFNSIKNKEF